MKIHAMRHLITQSIFLQPIDKWFIFSFKGFFLLFGLITIIQTKTLFGNILESFAVKFWQGLDGVLINGLNKVNNFITLLQESFDKW